MSDIRGDLIRLETGDGKIWIMPDGQRFITAYGGAGMPPTNFVTANHYRQAGVTERGYTLDDREVLITFHQVTNGNRQAYWDARAALLDLLRYNRSGTLTLTLITEDNEQRAIDCYADPGPILPPVDPGDDIWQIAETFNLRAFDPIWYDPNRVSMTGVRDVSNGGGLIFPTSFPIVFGPFAGAIYAFLVQYDGTFDTYPTFTITGPYNRATFIDNATGATFTLDNPISAGEQRIISLQAPNPMIVDAAGVNKIGDLAGGFDLIHFKIVPAPFAPDSGQTLTVGLEGSTLASSVTMTFYQRYIAI